MAVAGMVVLSRGQTRAMSRWWTAGPRWPRSRDSTARDDSEIGVVEGILERVFYEPERFSSSLRALLAKPTPGSDWNCAPPQRLTPAGGLAHSGLWLPALLQPSEAEVENLVRGNLSKGGAAAEQLGRSRAPTVSPPTYLLPPVMLSSLSVQDLPLPRPVLPGHDVAGESKHHDQVFFC